MMRMQAALWVTVLSSICTVFGCGGKISPEPPKGYLESVGTVVPLTGKIVLDGSAPQGVSVAALKAEQLTQEVQQQRAGDIPSLAVGGIVKPDGTIAFTTLTYGDGLPAGDYILLFRKELLTGEKSAASKVAAFNRKYANPETSKYKVPLEAGKPFDTGTIELSSP